MFLELSVVARSSAGSLLSVARLALGVIAFCAPALAAEPSNTSKSSTWDPTVQQWGLQELVLHSRQRYSNPFQDVKVAAVFGCSGHTVKVDGFYDGDGTWKVRLMPTQRGSCTFKTSSKDTALSGVTGRFVVEAPGAGDHGPVQVAKTYHFDYADGAPYFPLGTTSYNWLNRDPELQEHTLAADQSSKWVVISIGMAKIRNSPPAKPMSGPGACAAIVREISTGGPSRAEKPCLPGCNSNTSTASWPLASTACSARFSGKKRHSPGSSGARFRQFSFVALQGAAACDKCFAAAGCPAYFSYHARSFPLFDASTNHA